jgi:hypothetical protein
MLVVPLSLAALAAAQEPQTPSTAPPSGNRLTPAQIDRLRAWIDQGALA